jgi:hypothetical protein
MYVISTRAVQGDCKPLIVKGLDAQMRAWIDLRIFLVGKFSILNFSVQEFWKGVVKKPQSQDFLSAVGEGAVVGGVDAEFPWVPAVAGWGGVVFSVGEDGVGS